MRAEIKARLKLNRLSLPRPLRPERRRRHAREAQGRERARVAPRRRQGAGAPASWRTSTSARAGACAGSGAKQRAALLEAFAEASQRSPAGRATVGVLLVLAGPSGVGKGTIGSAPASAEPNLVWSVSATLAPAAPGRGRRRRLPLREPRGVRAAPGRGRLPRVVRGLRPAEGHPPGAGRAARSRRDGTCCWRSTSRAPWRSGTRFPQRSWCSCGRPTRAEQRGAAAGPGHRRPGAARPAARRGARPRRRWRTGSTPSW